MLHARLKTANTTAAAWPCMTTPPTRARKPAARGPSLSRSTAYGGGSHPRDCRNGRPAAPVRGPRRRYRNARHARASDGTVALASHRAMLERCATSLLAALRRSPLERDVTLPMLLVAFAAAILAACAGCCVLRRGAWHGRWSRRASWRWRVSADAIEDVCRLAGVAVDGVASVVGPVCPWVLELDERERVAIRRGVGGWPGWAWRRARIWRGW
jgi:hypothetical protein